MVKRVYSRLNEKKKTMLKIHQEGIVIIVLSILLLLGVNALIYQLAPYNTELHWKSGVI